jgi:hypothetical protein
MTNAQKWFCIISLLLLAIVGIAQQQYSGGQAVSITSGTVTATQATGSNLHVQVDAAPTTAVTGTFWQSTQPVSLATAPALVASTAKIGITYPYTSCGATPITVALQALPTVTTTVTGTTTCLLSLSLQNTSSSTSYTVTITDGQGSPVSFLNAVTLNPLETREYSYPNGMKFTTGIKWSATNAAVTGAIEGLQ